MKQLSTASGSTSSGASSAPPVHPHSHGLRSQLGHLIPKHALFQVHLHIEQLSNVPLMSGEFAVRWKFKNVQSGSGLLSKMKANRSWSGQSRGKGDTIAEQDAAGSGTGTATEEGEMEEEDEVDYGDNARDDTGTDDASYHDRPRSALGHNGHDGPHHHQHHLHPHHALEPSHPPSTPTPVVNGQAASSASLLTRSEARGMTPWAKLQSYNVKWEHSVNVVVQMDVHRETGDLLPNELKLVVMQQSPRTPRDAQDAAKGIPTMMPLRGGPGHAQSSCMLCPAAAIQGAQVVLLRRGVMHGTYSGGIAASAPSQSTSPRLARLPASKQSGLRTLRKDKRVIPGDPDSPQQPRIGAVYLNLAEYADAGKVTRRYLLRQSKTNATLKLSIELEHIGGEKHYKPPPLRKGEILASVSGILSNNGLFNTRFARELDLYVGADKPEDDDTFPYADKQGHVQPDQLVNSYGLRTTEHLIEALFNPVPSNSVDQTPFTYYAPPHPPEPHDLLADTSNDSLDSENGRRSVDSSVGSASYIATASEHSSTTGFEHGMVAAAAGGRAALGVASTLVAEDP
ncbi:hypothetical protein ONZ51_g7136 [Trametes cubensis]|uniref:C2 NT-type domain-containing protein n=1 Tax=Trametes cubensis TaxID=1111947 RepID=A0AAD7TQS3_9APHY|nr:hypothetical protein ONZ51_g7136 [Trametes cubensis]